MTSLRTLAATTFMILTAGAAMADRINVASAHDVDGAAARLTEAVEAAGARIFTTVDFRKGAATQGQTLRPTKLVIFGNPRIGSTALQTGQTMALYLPLRVLFYEDAQGQTWAIYDDPAGVAPSHGIAADDPAIKRMQAALERFVGIATGG